MGKDIIYKREYNIINTTEQIYFRDYTIKDNPKEYIKDCSDYGKLPYKLRHSEQKIVDDLLVNKYRKIENKSKYEFLCLVIYSTNSACENCKISLNSLNQNVELKRN